MKLKSLMATAFVVTVGSVIFAQSPAEKTKPGATEKATPPRLDRFGNPLPTGATARLGTVQLRQGPAIYKLAFAPDNKRLIAIGRKIIRTWDVASGKELASADWLPDSLYFALSSDGKTLASAEYSGYFVTVWNTTNGKMIHRFKVDPENRCWGGIAISPDDKVLAVGFSEHTMLWDLGTGKPMRAIPGRAHSVAPSPKAELIATHYQKSVEIWKTSTGNKISEFAEDNVWAMAFCPNGKLLATGNYNKEVRLIEAATGKEVHRLAGDGTTQVLVFSHDARIIAAGSRDGAICLWNVETGKRLRRFDDYQAKVHGIAFSHDNKMFASAHDDGTIRLWNVTTGKQIHRTDCHRGVVTSLALTADAKTLYSAGQDGLIGVWDLASAKKRHDLGSGKRFGDHCALTPDGFHLAIGGREQGRRRGDVTFWDLRADKESWAVPEHVPWTISLTVAANGKIIAAGTSGNQIVLCDARGKSQGTIRYESPEEGSETGATGLVEISHDSKLLTAASGMGIRVWQLDSRKHLFFLSPDGKLAHRSVRSIAFSPDDRLLVSAEEKGIHLWEMATGKQVFMVPDLQWQPCVVKFSPDGRLLAKGTRDGDVVIYEVGNEKPAAVFKGHRAAIYSLVFFPDSHRLASGSADTTILIWDLREMQSKPAAKLGLTAKDLERSWSDLDSSDPAVAFKAICRMARDPDQSLPFLEKRLEPAPRLEPGRLDRLIRDLGSAQFAVRAAATKELETFGEAALPDLRKALAEKAPLETRRRAEELVARMDTGFLPPAGLLRQLRALSVLEQIRTPAAQKMLHSLAEGTPESRITVEAGKSLARVK